VIGAGLGTLSPKAETKCEISVQLLMFPIENLVFNEYRSRAWTVYFANTQFKKILKIQLGEGLNYPNSPLGTPVPGMV